MQDSTVPTMAISCERDKETQTVKSQNLLIFMSYRITLPLSDEEVESIDLFCNVLVTDKPLKAF